MLALLLNWTVCSGQITLTEAQAKHLIKKAIRVQELDTINKLQEAAIHALRQTVDDQKNVIREQEELIEGKDRLLLVKEAKLSGMEAELVKTRKSLRREKIMKWGAIIIGSTASGYLGIRLITH